MAGWLLGSVIPPAWNRLTTHPTMKPPTRRTADRRSDLRSAREPVRVPEVGVPFATDISFLLVRPWCRISRCRQNLAREPPPRLRHEASSRPCCGPRVIPPGWRTTPGRGSCWLRHAPDADQQPDARHDRKELRNVRGNRTLGREARDTE